MFCRFLVFRVERPFKRFRARERLKERNRFAFKIRVRCEDRWYCQGKHIACLPLSFVLLRYDECEHNVSAPSVLKS